MSIDRLEKDDLVRILKLCFETEELRKVVGGLGDEISTLSGAGLLKVKEIIGLTKQLDSYTKALEKERGETARLKKVNDVIHSGNVDLDTVVASQKLQIVNFDARVVSQRIQIIGLEAQVKRLIESDGIDT